MRSSIEAAAGSRSNFKQHSSGICCTWTLHTLNQLPYCRPSCVVLRAGCNDGYPGGGPPTSTCLEDGSWSLPVGTCRKGEAGEEWR